MRQTCKGFGPARALAQRLADSDRCEYGVLTTNGVDFLIESEHEPIYAMGKVLNSDRIVFVATPGASKEEIFREALETIAYPANWPEMTGHEFTEKGLAPYQWMQAVAANALTNSGKV